MKLLALALAGGLATAASTAAVATSVSREQAEAFQQKLARIVQQGEAKSDRERSTLITEGEVNSYLTFKAGDQLPVGVTEPSIAIQSQGRLSGRAVVDLDVIRKKGSGSWLDPKSYLTGTLPLTATGTLRTADGQGRFELETAAVSGVPIPKTFLQEIVSYYTRTAADPDGIGIDDPFELPAEIRRIDADSGKAVIIQ
jgi:hypothetical protein